MAFSETFQTSTVFLKISLILAPLGGLLHLIGLSSNYWSYNKQNVNVRIASFGLSATSEYYSGLWQYCLNGECNFISSPEDWLLACRAMAILGLFAVAGTTFLVFMAACIATFSQRKLIHVTALIAALASAGFIFLTIIIYGSMSKARYSVEMNPHWSFGIDVVALIVYVVIGVLLLINLLKKRE